MHIYCGSILLVLLKIQNSINLYYSLIKSKFFIIIKSIVYYCNYLLSNYFGKYKWFNGQNNGLIYQNNNLVSQKSNLIPANDEIAIGLKMKKVIVFESIFLPIYVNFCDFFFVKLCQTVYLCLGKIGLIPSQKQMTICIQIISVIVQTMVILLKIEFLKCFNREEFLHFQESDFPS